MELYLVGESQFDTKSPQRAVSLIRYLHPDIIALEMTEQNMSDFISAASRLQDIVQKGERQIRTIAFLPGTNPATAFNLVALQYFHAKAIYDEAIRHDKTGANILYLPQESHRFVETTRKLDFTANGIPEELHKAMALTSDKLEARVAAEYDCKAYNVEQDENHRDWLLTVDRMITMQFRRTRLDQGAGQKPRIAFFGSLDRVFGDHYNLSLRLSRYHPTTLKLNFADTLMPEEAKTR